MYSAELKIHIVSIYISQMSLIQVVSQSWLEDEGKKEENKKPNMVKTKGIRIEKLTLSSRQWW
jgi:hypothetical protein